MTFEHPALSAAASKLAALRTAAGRIGAPDPVAVLRHLDCSPAAIRASAEAVGVGSRELSTAKREFRGGVDRAETGGSAEAFGIWADTVDGRYGAAVVAASATATVGARIADRLDALAATTASEVSSIAETAEPPVSAVLSGDRSPEVVSAVSGACATVVRVVQARVASMAALVAELEPLTAPAVYLS